MGANEDLIRKFYAAFQRVDYKTMQKCYHSKATYYDPIFGTLSSREVKAMWKMLCLGANNLSFILKNVRAGKDTGSCDWSAAYYLAATKRTIINEVHTVFKFKEGKIIEHRDRFSLWKWSRMALGMPGWLYGWSPFFKRAIQGETKKRLKEFMK